MVSSRSGRAAGRRDGARRLLIGVATVSGVGVVVAALWFLVLRPEAQAPRAASEGGISLESLESLESPENEFTDVVEAPLPPLEPELSHNGATLLPAEVLGKPDCRMSAGRRAASDLAVVILPHESGARFSVVDGNGEVAGGTLPFMPNHYKIGKREDGIPLIGLGALRSDSGTLRSMDSPEPLRIYLGEHMIYETDKAWRFAVANDASSYAVLEPLGSEASRLVVRNLEGGTEQHFDLGTRMKPTDAYKGELSLAHSPDNTEIMLRLAQFDGSGKYGFYPVGDGRTRGVRVEDLKGAVLVSSREGYFADYPENLKPDEYNKVWEITKRRFDFANGTFKNVWSRRLDLGKHFGGKMFLSDNGKWLGVPGPNSFRSLNTQNGDTVYRRHHGQQPATSVDEVGADEPASDLNALHLRSYPDFLPGQPGCMPGDSLQDDSGTLLFGGLQDDSGTLTYLRNGTLTYLRNAR